jgi:hypothetical protein
MPTTVSRQSSLSFALRGDPEVTSWVRGLTRACRAARGHLRAPPTAWWLASALVVLFVLFFLALLLEPTVGRGGR